MKKLLITLAIASMACSSPLFAAKAYTTATVTSVVLDDDKYGQCMVRLSQSISQSGLDCPSNWVSFSCSGDFNPKDMAYHKLETAQMSLLLGKEIRIYVDDAKKHNGYCYGYRVDLLN